MEWLEDRRLLSSSYFFSQQDSRWSGDPIIDENGTNCGTIQSIGAAMTDVAMVLKYYGVDTGPKQLNAWLNGHDGYFTGGNIYWGKADEYSGGRVEYKSDLSWDPGSNWPTDNDHWTELKAQLDQGYPVIVKVDAYPSTPALDQHWVLVTAFNGGSETSPGNYSINDPWDLQFEANATLARYYDATYVNTFFATRVYQADITEPTVSDAAASPTAVARDSDLTITWTATDNVAVDHIGLYLYQDSTSVDTRPYVTGGTIDGQLRAEPVYPNNGQYIWTVPSNLPVGTYRIKVVAWDTWNRTGYRYSNDFAVHAVLLGDDFEPDDTAAQAKTVATDGTTQTHSLHAGTDVDWVKFTLTQTNDVTIETDGPSGDTIVALYGPDNSATFIEEDDDDGNGSFSKIVRSGANANQLSPGTYYVKVTEFGRDDPIASYMISVIAPPVDTTPPQPNPSIWATTPYATGSTSISMIATGASDPSGVEYYFDETTGNTGGSDSGWQASATYLDTGLSPNTTYTYQVKTRDQSPAQNEGGYSTSASATTQQAADTTPPTPNPSIWATAPYATGSTSISMTATSASDPSGVEYYFDETTGNTGGSDSGWQDSAVYIDSDLTPGAVYSYRVKTRDKSANQNPGAYSEVRSATTPRTPVIILPGILGSMPRDNYGSWFVLGQVAMQPENLQLDPIQRAYGDVIDSLIAAGYNDGTAGGLQTLWAAPYDWRLPVAPRDGVADGDIDTTGLDPTDTQWEFGVEYLDYWIEQARAKWVDSGYDEAAFSVDIVGHSMGGLVARSYIQSGLYQLGEIDKLLMLGTPNHGAVDAYQMREWVNAGLEFVVDKAVDTVAAGLTSLGPAGALAGMILVAGAKAVGAPSLQMYSPSITDLLPTFDFVSTLLPHKSVHGIDDNTLLIDLNSAYDYFAKDVETKVLYGTEIETDYELYHPLGIDLFNMWSYHDLPRGAGDGRVLASSAALNGVDGEALGEAVEHGRLGGASTTVQDEIFSFLGISPPLGGYRTGEYRSLTEAITDVVTGKITETIKGVIGLFDPVDAIVTDPLGRRVGHTDVDGTVNEIPDTWYSGDGEYELLVISNPVDGDYAITYYGLDQEFVGAVSAFENGGSVTTAESGTLASGATMSDATNLGADTAGPVIVNDPPFTTLSYAVEEIRLRFSELLDTVCAQDPANYILAGPNGQVAFESIVYDPSGASVILIPTGCPLSPGNYAITVNGSSSLRDLAGNVMDGDGDGLPGGDYSFTFQIREPREVGDLVWNDLNSNGVQDPGEPRIAGAVVEVFSSTDGVVGNADDVSRGVAITDASGQYSFTGLLDGVNYYLVFRTPVGDGGGYIFSPQDAGTPNDDALDSDANATGVTAMFTLNPGQNRTDLDAGLVGSAPGFGWGLRAGAGWGEASSAVATDLSRNLYVTGHFEGTVDFDAGPGVYNLIGPTGSYYIFAAKYSPTGALVWARVMGGGGLDEGYSIAVGADESVYTAGRFYGTSDFDPGPGTFNLTSAGDADIFVSKLDFAGNFVWARSMGGPAYDQGWRITTGADGSLYIAGQFAGAADFDPGAGTFNLTSAGDADIFVSKLDSAGNFVWTRSMGGSGIEYCGLVEVGSDGSLYTAGQFEGTADFDAGNSYPDNRDILTSAGGTDIFVTKLDSAGTFVWARSMGGSNWDAFSGFTVAGDGSVYTAGYFLDIADFDPGPGTFDLTSAGGADIFVSKLDFAGNFVWARSMGGTDWDFARAIAVGPDGGVYTAGIFEGTADLDPGADTFNLTSAGDADIFVSKLDSAGNFLWARGMGGTAYDYGYGIAVDGDGSVYTTGSFRGTADFDPGSGTFNLTSAGADDIFLSKLDPLQLLSIGDRVWQDTDGDGIQDVGEAGVAGAVVELFGSCDATIGNADDFSRGQVITDASGQYSFTGLLDGVNYYLVFRTPVGDGGGYIFSPQDAGTPNDDALDSDADGTGVTAMFTLAPDENRTDLDAGMVGAPPPFGWALRAGAADEDIGYSVVSDPSGNVYVSGSFQGTADFDRGPGVYNLTSTGDGNAFVAKYSSVGSLVWARSMGGTDGAGGYAVALSADGSVYTTGAFVGTVDFDPGAGTANLTAVGLDDVFVSKLDAAGNYVWARQFGGSSPDVGYAIAVDGWGNVYTTGSFCHTVDFDPGPATADLDGHNCGAFVSKLDSAGNFVWARQLSGSGYAWGDGIAIDGGGNVYTAGNFQGTVDFDPGPDALNLTAVGSGWNDIFVSKLDSAGNFVWARTMGGAGNDNCYGMALAGDGSVYTTGYFNGTVDFDPGGGTFNRTSAGGVDIFVSKLDSDGNFLWAGAIGGAADDRGYRIAVAADGSVYTTGYFGGTVNFDPGAGTFNLTSAGASDIFVCRLDSAGNFVWARAVGGTTADEGVSIAVAADGSLYTTGYFQGTPDFDPGPGTFNLTSAGGYDIFVSKFLPPDEIAPTLANWALTDDTGASDTDKITKDATPTLAFAFSEVVTGGDNDISVTRPDSSPVAADSINGWGTDTVTVTFSTALTLDGQYTVTLKGTSTIRDAAGNPLNGGANEVLHFTLDTTRPQITAAQLATTDRRPQLAGTVDASVAGLSALSVTVDGSTYYWPDDINLAGTAWTLPDDRITPALAAGNYDVTVTATDLAGNTGTDRTIGELTIYSSIAGRHIFYNNCKWDGHTGFENGDPAANEFDDAARATGKVALLPGGTGALVNYTSYLKGINGIMIDIDGLPGAVTEADFQFMLGNSINLATWTPAPAPASVTLRPGAGNGGSDRVTVIWDDNTIKNKWLQVTVLAASTGLAGDDVHYWGNQAGETGNNAANTRVDAGDASAVRAHYSGLDTVAVTSLYDINRDKRVDAGDFSGIRANYTGLGASLVYLVAPTPAPGALTSGRVLGEDNAVPAASDQTRAERLVAKRRAMAVASSAAAREAVRAVALRDSLRGRLLPSAAHLEENLLDLLARIERRRRR